MNTLLIQDTSVLLNLYASQKAPEIVRASGMVVAVCPEVLAEALFIRDFDSGSPVPIDISPLTRSGVLEVQAVAGEAELADQIFFASQTDSDADGAVLSLAKNRGAHLATDDRISSRLFRGFSDDAHLWSTPRLLHQWSNHSSAADAEVRSALLRITRCCRYVPPERDKYHEWWAQMIS